VSEQKTGSRKPFSEIYKDLKTLAETSESFFFKDVVMNGTIYRIFNYRLCSYSDFLLPSAVECRGIMFEIHGDGTVIDITSRPMQKFWNFRENPFTENVDFSKVTHAMVKEDGSLISSYIHKGELKLKTKGSLDSDQAIDSMNWLSQEKHKRLYGESFVLSSQGYTVNFEWTSPNNRVVLGYEHDGLIVLNIRNNFTGEYVPYDQYPPVMKKYAVMDELEFIEDIESFVHEIPAKNGMEGYVLRLDDGQMVKIKTEWYMARHRAKDSINTPKNLFKAIVGEEIDDIIVMFEEDEIAMKIITDMIDLVKPKYNHMIATVELYHEVNAHLERKEYAIKARDLDDGLMGLYMNMYTGKENNYKTFAKKNFEMFIGKADDD